MEEGLVNSPKLKMWFVPVVALALPLASCGTDSHAASRKGVSAELLRFLKSADAGDWKAIDEAAQRGDARANFVAACRAGLRTPETLTRLKELGDSGNDHATHAFCQLALSDEAPENDEAALTRLRALDRLNSVQAARDLADAYMHAHGVPYDFALAAEYANEASVRSDGADVDLDLLAHAIAAIGQVDLGRYPEARRIVAKSEAIGNATEQYVKLLTQKDNSATDGERFVTKLAELALQECPHATIAIARIARDTGDLTLVEPNDLDALLKKGAEAGWMEAHLLRYQLAICSADEAAEGIIKASNEHAFDDFLYEADLAEIFAEIHKELDLEDHASLTFHAALLGGRRASIALLGNDTLVADPVTMRLGLASRMARSGDPAGQYNLAKMLLEGTDKTLPNSFEAVRWLIDASVQDQQGAVLELESCLRNGLGIVKDTDAADKLLAIYAETSPETEGREK